MSSLFRLLFDPFVWLGAGAGLVVGTMVLAFVRQLRPAKRGSLFSSALVASALILGVAFSLVYEEHILTRLSTSIAGDLPVERLTATATEFEFRSMKYSSKAELVSALRSGSPRPERIRVTWFATASDLDDRGAAIANAELARAAVREAGLPMPAAAIGIEYVGTAGVQSSAPR